jgi:hypothetical protein
MHSLIHYFCDATNTQKTPEIFRRFSRRNAKGKV